MQNISNGLFLRRTASAAFIFATALGFLLLITAPVLAADQDPCEGYTGKQRVSRFGGPHAFSKKKVESLADLQAVFAEHEAEIWEVFKAKGMEDLGDAFFAAVKSGQGVREMQVGPGDTLDWMALRRAGKPEVIDGVCVAPMPKRDRTYAAFRIEIVSESKPDCNTIERTTAVFAVPKICSNLSLLDQRQETERLPPIPPPVCKLSASRSCDTARLLAADASGSSEGVQVTLGGQTVIPNSSSKLTWEGPDSTPYSPATFVATAENQDRCGNVQRCEESVTVDPCRRASCTITPSVTEARSGQPFSIDVSGYWAEDGLEVSVYRGDKLVRDLGGSFPTEVKLPAGDYTLRGSAVNELGDSESCNEPTVEVTRRWTVRPALAYWDTDRSVFTTSDILLSGVPERTKLDIGGGGTGVSLGLEYYFNDKVGLEGELQYVEVDSSFVLDLGEDWGMDDEELGTFALFVGPNFHLTRNSRADFYIGPFVGWVSAGDGDYEALGTTEEVGLDSEAAFGLKLGLDIPFGAANPWAFHVGARYLDLSLDAKNRNRELELNLDPIIATVGVSYSF